MREKQINIAGTTLLGISLLLTSSHVGAMPHSNAGSEWCYNKVTHGCNQKHPGGGYPQGGGTPYSSCIDRGLDKCDIKHPSGRYGVSKLPYSKYLNRWERGRKLQLR